MRRWGLETQYLLYRLRDKCSVFEYLSALIGMFREDLTGPTGASARKPRRPPHNRRSRRQTPTIANLRF